MKAPCRECGKREIGCHARCVEYKAFSEKVERIRERRHEYAEKDVLELERIQRRERKGPWETKRDERR